MMTKEDAAKYVAMLVSGEWGIQVDDNRYDGDGGFDDYGFCLYRMDQNIMFRNIDGLDCECAVKEIDYLIDLISKQRKPATSLYLL